MPTILVINSGTIYQDILEQQLDKKRQRRISHQIGKMSENTTRTMRHGCNKNFQLVMTLLHCGPA